MLELFDKPVMRTEPATVRGAKTTLHEINSDQWHEHIALYDDDEIEQRKHLKGKALAMEHLDFNRRLVACSLMNNHPDATFDDVLASVRALSDDVLASLLETVRDINGLNNDALEGNSPAAGSGTD